MAVSLRPILAAIRSSTMEPAAAGKAERALPFVTISRQAGVGAVSLAARLAGKLAEMDPGEPPWEKFEDYPGGDGVATCDQCNWGSV